MPLTNRLPHNGRANEPGPTCHQKLHVLLHSNGLSISVSAGATASLFDRIAAQNDYSDGCCQQPLTAKFPDHPNERFLFYDPRPPKAFVVKNAND
jgi:hypothetical protein